MADQEEAFGLQNSPSGSEPRDVQSENKPESKQTASKSPSSQTTYIQQVSGVPLDGFSGLEASVCCRCMLPSLTSKVTLT